PVLRGLADQLWALHATAYDYAATRPNARAQQVQRYETVFRSTVYETEHPVMQVHPLTEETAIVLGSFVRRLPGISSEASAHVFAMLQDHGSRDAAGKHRALALVGGRCGDLGQSCDDPAQGDR